MIKNRRALCTVAVLVAGALTGCPESPPPPAPTSPTPAPAAKTPLVPKSEVADWCGEHGVPESICTRCNAKLIAEFKAKKDWCAKHELPDSQCLGCHPELEPKLKALAPKK